MMDRWSSEQLKKMLGLMPEQRLPERFVELYNLMYECQQPVYSGRLTKEMMAILVFHYRLEMQQAERPGAEQASSPPRRGRPKKKSEAPAIEVEIG